MTTLREFVGNVARSSRAYSRAYVALRGVPRTLTVAGKTIHFETGPGEYNRSCGIDVDGVFEGPFLERLAASIAEQRNAVYFDVGGGGRRRFSGCFRLRR